MNKRSLLPENCWVSVSRAGRKRCAKNSMNVQPISAMTIAGALISNIVNGANPMSRATPSTRMLVEVPTMVIRPPRIVA